MRQLVFSAIREAAVCSIGDLCPSNRPVTTTASTPEAWMASAGTNATQGATKDSVVSRIGSRICLRIFASTTPASNPTATPPPAAKQESPAHLEDGHRSGQGRDRDIERDERGGVVDQALALQDRDDPAGHPGSSGNGAGCDGIRGCDDGTKSQRRRQRDRGNPPGDKADEDRRERDRADRQQG